ncbi:hypothetical protein CVT24_003890 [Panaeolus cyanescens]|uniref:Fatty acid desaturase domain-containing protein n=1 Tax=Panaeolus cyanescens TaxID=181874 RepID=A0A409VVA3_9AGAR|nr:hypothetical protein CVT24_003890 [Panaeolus cyanescens]
MLWYQIFRDGPEYEARKRRGEVEPPNLSLKDIHNAVPRHLLERSTVISLWYILQHAAITFGFFYLGTQIDTAVNMAIKHDPFALSPGVWRNVVRPLLWFSYWAWQGFAFAGIWCLGHEAGHGALSTSRFINDVLGLILHTFVLTPYHSWRVTHATHHKSTNHLDRDETYVPPTRRDLKLPDGKVAVRMDYVELIEETPAFTLFKLFIRQFFGFQLYILHNRKGNPRYPKFTSHYIPSSKLFQPKHRNSIILSDIFIAGMLSLLFFLSREKGRAEVLAHYVLPWLHSDPTIPYYRANEWTYARALLDLALPTHLIIHIDIQI